MRELAGRTALITGAAGGIGTALAERLHAAGMRLVLTDVDGPAVDALAARLGASAHVLDVRDPGAWDALAHELPSLDLLVHNAGLTVHAPFDRLTAADLDRVVDVDLRGPLQGTRALLPLLRRSPGAHVVLVSSMAALFGVPFQSAYTAAKWGLRGFGHALRIELAADDIGVTVVLPGTIATSFLAHAKTADASAASALSRLMVRYGTPPARVAARVEAAVRRNKGELRVGWDAHLVACVQAWLPPILPALLTLGYRRMRPLPPERP